MLLALLLHAAFELARGNEPAVARRLARFDELQACVARTHARVRPARADAEIPDGVRPCHGWNEPDA